MIDRMCVFVEALSIIACLHYLYGEKFRLDIKAVVFLALDMILMTAIDYGMLPRKLSISIYIFLAVYAGSRFGWNWKKIFVNEVVCVIIVGIFQLIAMFAYYQISGVQYCLHWGLLIMNILIFMIIVILFPKLKLKQVFNYLYQKEIILVVSMIICSGVVLFCIVNFKKLNIFRAYEYVILFVVVLLICVLAAQMIKYKVKSAEIEMELKMQQIYMDSFKNLIENIRMKQHEFDNHINTIFSQHYLYSTYEELVEAQRGYGQEIVKENQYNKMLNNGNSVIIGFLYGKFLELDKKNIKVKYEIDIQKFDIGVPTYKVIEILGDLINNAIEAMADDKKEIFVKVIEVNGYFEINVKNISPVIAYDEIHKFFGKGYSKKGESRGWGLYNVKNICSEYKLSIICENEEVDKRNWLTFKIINKKNY